MSNDNLMDKLKSVLSGGLKRRSIKKCSTWAKDNIIMGKPFPGPYNHDHHPWAKDMEDSEATWNIGQKSAQMGYTVVLMNRTLYHIDINRYNCLYLLPTKTPDATDFSATRFDPMLELSPKVEELFSDVKNVATKRAGSATLYIRGANSRSGLKSIPVSFIGFDEFDEMKQENIPLAIERTSGQLYKQFWAISTPTVPEHGINALFLDSTQEHWCFPCPLCGVRTELIYPDCLVVTADEVSDPRLHDSHIICKECKGKLNHEDKPMFLKNGVWVPFGNQNFDYRGFYINQLYSPTIKPVDLAKAVIKARTDLSSEQELWNSKIGMPHVVAGARIDDEMISNSIAKSAGRFKSHKVPPGLIICMGIDVGTWLHYEVTGYILKNGLGSDINILSDALVLDEGEILEFHRLDDLMKRWGVRSCVIDQGPERRKALEFAQRWPGFVKLCYFGNQMSGKSMTVDSDRTTHKITADRTSWLDIALGRFHNGSIALPGDVTPKYKEQLKSPVRIYKKDQYGNPVGDYISVAKGAKVMEDSKNAQDHFAFARCYCEMALPLAATLMSNSNIERFI